VIAVSHATGNANVRAVLASLANRGLLERFFTTIGVSCDSQGVAARLFSRRRFPVPAERLQCTPLREIVRLASSRFALLQSLTRHETGWASADAVCRSLDERVARTVRQAKPRWHGVYAYEDGALESFRAAAAAGIRRIYDLPIAYYSTAQRLLKDEAVRLPEWEPTLGGTRDSPAKLERKAQEMELADLVVCPSRFVLESIPEELRSRKRCTVAEFGSPASAEGTVASDTPPSFSPSRPLRVLFAGSMTQRKGLADLFGAFRMINRRDVELVVMGSPSASQEFYRSQYSDFRYEPPRSHAEVLQLMRSCDVFVLPSIVEGRALVQQEAMSCGLPLIVTANAGAEDLIVEGMTGFLVPIRSPEAIVEKILWFLQNPTMLPQMRMAVVRKAATLTWEAYGKKVVAAVETLLAEDPKPLKGVPA
jgi:glycosyltransferase involved in cell wall biosynthesis